VYQKKFKFKNIVGIYAIKSTETSICQAKINYNKPSEIKALKLAAETKPNSTECVHFIPII